MRMGTSAPWKYGWDVAAPDETDVLYSRCGKGMARKSIFGITVLRFGS